MAIFEFRGPTIDQRKEALTNTTFLGVRLNGWMVVGVRIGEFRKSWGSKLRVARSRMTAPGVLRRARRLSSIARKSCVLERTV